MATNSYIQKVGGYIKYGRKLIPNTGEGGDVDGSYKIMTGKITLKKSTSGTLAVSYINALEDVGCIVPDYINATVSGVDVNDVAVIDGVVCLRQQSVASPVVTGDGVESFQNVSFNGRYYTVIAVDDLTKDILVVF